NALRCLSKRLWSSFVKGCVHGSRCDVAAAAGCLAEVLGLSYHFIIFRLGNRKPPCKIKQVCVGFSGNA
ncbi:hypothetical protein, partial [Aestuariivirga sp.]|uniref:hypothetical protein n=1 Tax=Aestuariivirga sp. TaxID=2650926 RepID=UPI003784C4AA